MRSPEARLQDVLDAIEAIERHLASGDLSADVVFDAVRMRLIEIGEAVKAVPEALRATEPQIPWRDVAGMRDLLAHRYFDALHARVEATALEDLPLLAAAVRRILGRL